MKHRVLVTFEVETDDKEFAEEVVSRITDQFYGPTVTAWVEKASLVEDAYREGWRDSENSTNGFCCIQEGQSWEASEARKAIMAEGVE